MNDTDKARQLFFDALRLFDSADYVNAELRLRDALSFAPGNASILTNLATVALRRDKFDAARDFSAQALARTPDNVEALLVLASCHAREEKFADALACCDKIIALEPRIAEVHSNRAQALNGLDRFAEALASCDHAIALQPRLADAHTNRGNSLVRLKRHGEALDAFDQALRLKPALAEANLGRGNALCGLMRYEAAIAAYDLAIAARSDLVAAWLGRGAALAGMYSFKEADAALDRALAISPTLARAWLARGNIYRHLGRQDEAVAAFDKAIAAFDKADPGLAEAWQARGATFADMMRYADALRAYDRALAVKPDLEGLAGFRLYAKMWLCDWADFADESARLIDAMRAGGSVLEPMMLLALSSSAADQLKCGEIHVATNAAARPASDLPDRRSSSDRLRVAYLSPDFGDHAVSFLTAGMLEEHDKGRFDVFGVSLSTDRDGAMRTRIKHAVTEFIDVSGRSDAEIVELLRSLPIDIAVDLAGHTRGGRPNVLARRVAPIQVSYLGLPATTGAPFIDYIVADRVLIPLESRALYSERVVYLPESFQANDSRRRIAEQAPARSAVGLPDHGFVFCAFHSSYKLNPSMFDIWMRLLGQVDGSVLWLVAHNPSVIENLRREAEARGVQPDRLVFAPHVPYADHLARHRLADLFLDTLPFNGGTTTSDALWAGLPVVTLSGEAFASRMSASLLSAIGLPELATASAAEYEALALDLARNPAALAEIKAKLARNRVTHPLFDTVRFTRHIEAAYQGMWERHRRGERPDSFAVGAID